MALQLIKNTSKPLNYFLKLNTSKVSQLIQKRTTTQNYVDQKFGKREIVGSGVNSNSVYVDWEAFPFPGIRFKEDTPEILELRDKEKGDWNSLTVAEMKELYRAQFCQTFAEMKSPTGEWKIVVAGALHAFAIALFTFMIMVRYVYSPLPVTFEDDHKKAQFRRMIEIEANPITGISSHFDYETRKFE